MGTRGPVPKRSDQRRRENKPEIAVAVAPASARAEMPPADEAWHDLARDMYCSLAVSGQSAFFEPSDWQAARLAAEATSRLLLSQRFSAVLLAAVNSMWSGLLMTEADRRRLRIELAKPKADTAAAAAVADLDQFRARFSG
jgi:hypothetical protein